MHYILDTRLFVITREYYPDIFPSFWEKLTEAVNKNTVSSVSEVSKEINKFGGPQKHLLTWINKHQNIFSRPSEGEQYKLRKIMSIFPDSLPEKNN